jgi:hypothetical protein
MDKPRVARVESNCRGAHHDRYVTITVTAGSQTATLTALLYFQHRRFPRVHDGRRQKKPTWLIFLNPSPTL